jgi:hypothetical protein
MTLQPDSTASESENRNLQEEKMLLHRAEQSMQARSSAVITHARIPTGKPSEISLLNVGLEIPCQGSGLLLNEV